MQVVYFSFSLVYIHSFILTQMIAYSVTGCKPVSSLKNVSSKIFLAFWPSKNILFIVLHFVILINFFGCTIGWICVFWKKKQRFCKIFDLILHTYFTHISELKTTTQNCAIYILNRSAIIFLPSTGTFLFQGVRYLQGLASRSCM